MSDALSNNPRPGVGLDDLETALLYLLVDEAFDDRPIASTRDGHGLHAIGVAAHHWHSRAHVFSATAAQGSDAVVHVSGGDGTQAHRRLDLPGARGTLVHVTLPANAPDVARLPPTNAMVRELAASR